MLNHWGDYDPVPELFEAGRGPASAAASGVGRGIWFSGAALLAFAVAMPVLVSTGAFREAPVSPVIDDATAERRNTSALATILGEFRASTADMIFIKTERYLDSGVGYAPHLDMSAMAGSGQIQGKAPAAGANPPHGHPGHRHDHGDEDEATTAAPPAAANPPHGQPGHRHHDGEEEEPTTAAATLAKSANPPHGQPGHVHDHGDEDEATTATAAARPNPPHGQPGHRHHDGEEEPTTSAATATTPPNPAHGQPGHRHEDGDDKPGHAHHHHHHGAGEPEDTAAADTTAPETAARVVARIERKVASEGMKETASLKPGETLSEAHEGEAPPTIIRTRDRDFRGFIGELERQVKPWRDPSDPHKHTAGTELLPWYRLATLTDPHNVRCYMIGAWWLKNLPRGPQPEEALAFLDEGIANNPQAFQLVLMQSYLHSQLKHPDKALEKALTATDIALKKRPLWGVEAPGWNHYSEDDAIAAVTLAVVLTRDVKGEAAGKELALRLDAQTKGTMPITKRLAGLKPEEGVPPVTPRPEPAPSASGTTGAAGAPDAAGK